MSNVPPGKSSAWLNAESEIKEVIAKNLPAHVGDVLRARLEQAEKDAEKVVTQASAIASLKDRVDELLAIERNEASLIVRAAELDAREHDVSLREIRQEISDLRVTAANEKVHFAERIVLAVFANNRLKYYESETTSPQVPYVGGQYPQWTQGPTETKTKTVETEQ